MGYAILDGRPQAIVECESISRCQEWIGRQFGVPFRTVDDWLTGPQYVESRGAHCRDGFFSRLCLSPIHLPGRTPRGNHPPCGRGQTRCNSARVWRLGAVSTCRASGC